MSDYEKTQRRVIDNGTKIQYVAGGSRVRKEISHTQVSKVGEMNPSEVYYDKPPIVTPETIKAAIDEGKYKLPPGCKFMHDDEETTFYSEDRKYSRTDPVLPGDKIEITNPDHEDFGNRAVVKRVSNNFDVVAFLLNGPRQDIKINLSKDDYAIAVHYPGGKYHLSPDDYLYTNIRDDLVQEDKS